MPFNTATKNTMINLPIVNRISLHNGPPGDDGLLNEISGGGYTRQVCNFASAVNGERLLTADVPFTGPALAAVTHIGVWNNTGPVFRGWAAVSGASSFNSAGEYTVKANDTRLSLLD